MIMPIRPIPDYDPTCKLCFGNCLMCTKCEKPYATGAESELLCACAVPDLAHCGMCAGSGLEWD